MIKYPNPNQPATYGFNAVPTGNASILNGYGNAGIASEGIDYGTLSAQQAQSPAIIPKTTIPETTTPPPIDYTKTASYSNGFKTYNEDASNLWGLMGESQAEVDAYNALRTESIAGMTPTEIQAWDANQLKMNQTASNDMWSGLGSAAKIGTDIFGAGIQYLNYKNAADTLDFQKSAWQQNFDQQTDSYNRQVERQDSKDSFLSSKGV